MTNQQSNPHPSHSLWQQFTTEIQQLLTNDDFRTKDGGATLQEFFAKLIQPFSQQIDQYIYVTFALQVANLLPTANGYREQFELLNAVRATLGEGEFDSRALIDSSLAHYYVLDNQVFKALDLLVSVETQLNASTQIVNNLTHFQLHKSFALVEQKRGHHLKQFSRKLLMLSFAEANDLTFAAIAQFSPHEQSVVAREIAISALLSDQVYNFGEVLSHSTVHEYTPAALKSMLELFRCGNLAGFDEQVTANGDVFSPEDKSMLYRKLQVVALLNFIFSKPAPERTFDLSALIPVVNAQDEMDLCRLIIYALGVGVTRGQIDGVNKTVAFSWVQPRLLDTEQLKSLKKSVDISVEHTSNVIVTVFGALAETDQEVAEIKVK